MINTNLKNYLEEICKTNLAKEIGAQTNDFYINVSQAKSEFSAENIARFWNNIYSEKKEEIKSITFVYQERDEELPLSYGKNLLKK